MVHKLCLVTVGATAPFEKLIQAVLHESFIAELEKYDFTRLLIQYGKGGQPIFDSFRAEYEKGNITHDIQIGGFDLRPNMTPYVCMAREDPSMAQELGMMISHAGTGSILDALRAGLPLVIVPNPDLANNHQQELADHLAEEGYAIVGKLDDMPSVVGQAAQRGDQVPYFRRDNGDRSIMAMSDELSWVD